MYKEEEYIIQQW